MKQFSALFSLAFLLPAVSPAQDLAANTTPITKNYNWNTKTDSSISRETPSRKPQQWDREEDQVNGHIGKTQLAKMKNVNEALIAILRDSCISDGTSIWHGEFFSEKTSPGPILKFGVHCNYTANADLGVMANDLGPLLDHLVVRIRVHPILIGAPRIVEVFVQQRNQRRGGGSAAGPRCRLSGRRVRRFAARRQGFAAAVVNRDRNMRLTSVHWARRRYFYRIAVARHVDTCISD